jgi:hypothetical protein
MTPEYNNQSHFPKCSRFIVVSKQTSLEDRRGNHTATCMFRSATNIVLSLCVYGDVLVSAIDIPFVFGGHTQQILRYHDRNSLANLDDPRDKYYE